MRVYMSCKSFSIIVTSDLHGELGRFLTIAAHIRQKQPALLLDNGDLLQGGLSHAYDEAVGGNSTIIALANDLHYDALIIGNHEFNETKERFDALRKQSNFPWISCNLGDFAQPYIVKVIDGVRVLVVGVTTHFTPRWDEHGHAAHVHFSQAAEAVRTQLPLICEQEQPDFVVVSYHGGFQQDPNGAWQFDDGSGENEAEQLLDIPGIDLLITGHQHMCFAGEKNGVTYVQPGSHGYAYAELLVTQHQRQWHITPQLHPVDEVQPLPAPMTTWLDEEIGTLDRDYTYEGLLHVMQHGHPYIDWFHTFQRSVTGAQISVTELFFNERGGLPQRVTRRDVMRAYGRDNALVTMRMRGAAIHAALEQSAAVLAYNEAGEVDYAVNVYPNTLQPYQFDFFGGITYTCDMNAPVGSRIRNMFVADEPMQPDAFYTVAVNSFRALGHAPYTMYADAIELSRTQQFIPQLLEQYIRNT